MKKLLWATGLMWWGLGTATYALPTPPQTTPAPPKPDPSQGDAPVGGTQTPEDRQPTPVMSRNGLLIKAPVEAQTPAGSPNLTPSSAQTNPPTPVISRNGLLINAPVVEAQTPEISQSIPPSSPQPSQPTPANPPTPVTSQNGLLTTDQAGSNRDPSSLLEQEPASIRPNAVTQNGNTPDTPEPIPAELTSEFTPTPLMLPPIRLFNLDTANQLPAGTIQFTGGLFTYTTNPNLDPGNGLEVFYGSVDGGITDRWQLGLTANFFDDPIYRFIKGQNPNITVVTIAPNFKYQVFKGDNLAWSVGGSIEYLQFSSSNFVFAPGLGTTKDSMIVGSIQSPLTWTFDDDGHFQWHLTPSITFLPSTFTGGQPFYGTNFNLGTGFSWKFNQQVSVFGDVTVPVGPGQNAINAANGQLFITPVWSGGFRFLVNPAVGVDLYATNAFGTTPTLRTIAFPPDGASVSFGTGLTYTPEFGQNFLPSFRDRPRVPLTERDRQLLLNGFTIVTADTLLPEMMRLHGNFGGVGNGGSVAVGLTYDTQFELFVEKPEDGVSLLPGVNYSNQTNFGLAAKLRFLDQSQGDPLSIGFQGSFNRAVSGQISIATLQMPMNYRPIDSLALFFNPKVALMGGHQVPVGLGFGANFEVFPGLQLIAEATPILTGQRSVFSGGIRYTIPKTNFSIDIYGSNAAGQSMPVGGLIAQDGKSLGININWLFGGRD
ncbi:hypothetical protein RIF25_05540 [Thermosynechococcaceae cyanobacterium BACA0444]|uniref:Uncharacterized protein n=1 Tax=Pseudocalidococcus azoricus BACA0444 TaxID=2918990 RepID=A0AAE4JVE3_9CYAN|nr:hypothetical protein [Pseudocalidococcus azoricus]MDS3860265.1 hypothetical protein [Pseudocalidococcus azoricus BACA0444]